MKETKPGTGWQLPPVDIIESLGDVPTLARGIFWFGWCRWFARGLTLTESQANLARYFQVDQRSVKRAERALEHAEVVRISREANRRSIAVSRTSTVAPLSPNDSGEEGSSRHPTGATGGSDGDSLDREGGRSGHPTPRDSATTPNDAGKAATGPPEPAWMRAARDTLPEDLEALRPGWDRWVEHLRHRKRPTPSALDAQIEILRQVPTERRAELLEDCIASNAQGIPRWVADRFKGTSRDHRARGARAIREMIERGELELDQ